MTINKKQIKYAIYPKDKSQQIVFFLLYVQIWFFARGILSSFAKCSSIKKAKALESKKANIWRFFKRRDICIVKVGCKEKDLDWFKV